jgi:hypothetical protein
MSCGPRTRSTCCVTPPSIRPDFDPPRVNRTIRREGSQSLRLPLHPLAWRSREINLDQLPLLGPESLPLSVVHREHSVSFGTRDRGLVPRRIAVVGDRPHPARCTACHGVDSYAEPLTIEWPMPVTKNVARQFSPEYPVSWRSQPWALGGHPDDHSTGPTREVLSTSPYDTHKESKR